MAFLVELKKVQNAYLFIVGNKSIKRVKRMVKFNYKMCFSPYGNSLRARNYKEAWEVLKQTYPEYKNIKKVVQYLSRQ